MSFEKDYPKEYEEYKYYQRQHHILEAPKDADEVLEILPTRIGGAILDAGQAIYIDMEKGKMIGSGRNKNRTHAQDLVKLYLELKDDGLV